MTSVDMAQHQILPAALSYTSDLCKAIQRKQTLGLPCNAEVSIAKQLSSATDALYDCCQTLKDHLQNIPQNREDAANYYHSIINKDMAALRKEADILEQLTDKSYWPYPTYSDLLFY